MFFLDSLQKPDAEKKSNIRYGTLGRIRVYCTWELSVFECVLQMHTANFESSI